MDLWVALLGGALMAAATVVVAVITTRANRAVAQLRADVEKQQQATAERAEDRARYEGMLAANSRETAGLRDDLVRIRARLVILEDRDTAHMARVIAHMPWDARAEDVAERAGVPLGDVPPLL